MESRLLDPIWLVWAEDGDVVGPVSAHQVARGIRAGRVPSDARVKRETDVFWKDLMDEEQILTALKEVSVESEPPPPPSVRASLVAREYLVWMQGDEPVGPVSADQIARGIRAGKVPTDANMQKIGELFATGVLDEPQVILALKQL